MVLLMFVGGALANDRPIDCPAIPQGLDGGASFEPEYYRIDYRANERDAPQRAQDAARARLIARLSPRFTGYDLADLSSHTGADHTVVKQPDLSGPGIACGRAWVEREFLHTVLKQDRDLAQSLTELSERVAEKSRGQRVFVRAETIHQCPVPGLGGTLVQRVTGTAGSWTNTSASGVAYLLLAIDPTDAKGATANAWYYEPKSTTGVAVGQIKFNPSVLVANVEAAMAEARRPCATNAALGLSALGSRVGARNLVIDVPYESIPEPLCDGQMFTLPVTTSSDARVQLYSVDERGVAYLISDGNRSGGHIVGPDSPWGKRVAASAYADGRAEQLVIVAEPLTSKPSPAMSWRGDCKVDGAFSAGLFSADAALEVRRFQIVPGGTRQCPAVEDSPYPPTISQCGTGVLVPYP